MSETPKPRACYMRHGKVYDAQLKYVNATPAVAITRTAYDEVRRTMQTLLTHVEMMNLSHDATCNGVHNDSGMCEGAYIHDRVMTNARAALTLLPEIPE